MMAVPDQTRPHPALRPVATVLACIVGIGCGGPIDVELSSQ